MGLTDGNIFEIKDGIEMKFSNYNSYILEGNEIMGWILKLIKAENSSCKSIRIFLTINSEDRKDQ